MGAFPGDKSGDVGGTRRWIALAALGAFSACFLASFTRIRSLRTGGSRTVLTGAILAATAAALAVTVTFVLDKHSLGLFVYVAVNHLSAAIGKTGARNRAEAVRLADEHGWLLAT